MPRQSKVLDYLGCAWKLGPDVRARGAILWHETKNVRVRLGLASHRQGARFSLRTRYGTLHFRDNFGDITNLTDVVYRAVYRLPRPAGEGVILDVGANIGMAAVFLRAMYPGHAIHCFEPLPENTELAALNAPFARINTVAAGAAAGWTTLAVDADAVMASQVLHPRAAGERQVKVIPLDEYVQAEGVDKIAVIKIDTEGMELDVLTGARLALARTDQVVIETHGRSRHVEVLDLLLAEGFRISREVRPAQTGLVFAARPRAGEE